MIYDDIVSHETPFERKGKTMPYTSANGHMFSQLNKDDQLGIRFSKEEQLRYMKELNTEVFRSYGAVMQGYILIPEALWSDRNKIAELLNESYQYVLGLPPK